MLNNFSPRAQMVLALARKEADRLTHNYVGTEHLLLGILKLNQGVAVNVLTRLGVDLGTVRLLVERLTGSGPETKMADNIPYTSGVKEVLKLASKEAKSLNHSYVGTEHILLGLLLEGEGVAAQALRQLDVHFEKTRQEILEELGPCLSEPSERNFLLDVQTYPFRGGGWLTNFSPRAQMVLALARKEADRLTHNYVGTEHLLLGLIKLEQGVAVTVLTKLGVDLGTVRLLVEHLTGGGPDTNMADNIPYTSRVKKVLALASKEAKSLHHSYIGTEHLLLGLLREGEGVAALALRQLGVDLKKTRQEILEELGPSPDEPRERILLLDVLTYPFRGDGWLMILSGTVLSILLLIASLGGILGIVAVAFYGGFFASYYLDIINTTVNGSDDAPDWPDIADFMDDIVSPMLKAAGVFFISSVPLLLTLLMDKASPSKETCGLAARAFGAFYFPMAMLGFVMHGHLGGALPHRVFPAIFRALPGYLWVVLLFGASVVLSRLSDAAYELLYVGVILSAALSLYLLMAQARLIGLLYRSKREQIGWG